MAYNGAAAFLCSTRDVTNKERFSGRIFLANTCLPVAHSTGIYALVIKVVRSRDSAESGRFGVVKTEMPD